MQLLVCLSSDTLALVCIISLLSITASDDACSMVTNCASVRRHSGRRYCAGVAAGRLQDDTLQV